MNKSATLRPDQTRPDQNYVRNSSLELLRIVAMLGIVSLHFASGSGFKFPVDAITINRLWHKFICLGGYLGNDIFFMLSGYFLIKSSGIKPKKLFILWVKMFFYAVLFFLLFNFPAINSDELFYAMRPLTKNHWWFARTYFILYFIHPVLNIFLHKLSLSNYKKFLLAALIYWSIIPTIIDSRFKMSYILLYSIGAYIRLWADYAGSKKYILYGCLCVLINFMLSVIIDLVSPRFSFLVKNAMMMPFTIMTALFLLIGFKKLDVQYNSVVNLIASCTFGVYLIHQNKFVDQFLWHKLFHAASFQDSFYFIPYSIAVILLVYISCTLIELTRSKIFKTISGGRLS